jgi:hypothetical protein
MNALNLLEQHPKATAIIKSYYLEKLLSSVNSDIITEEFKEFVLAKGVPMESLLSIIDDVPRNLFDVFDTHKVYIDISGLNGVFLWGINGDMNDTLYQTRKEAERAAIVEAFKLLEEMS